jgi:hypothetical protein
MKKLVCCVATPSSPLAPDRQVSPQEVRPAQTASTSVSTTPAGSDGGGGPSLLPSASATPCASCTGSQGPAFPLAGVLLDDAPSGMQPVPHYLAMAADVYLRPAQDGPPGDLRQFGGARRLRLTRLEDGGTMEELDGVVRPVVGRYEGRALRVVGSLRSSSGIGREEYASLVLVAPTMEVCEQWLAALRLRIASWRMLRMETVCALKSVQVGAIGESVGSPQDTPLAKALMRTIAPSEPYRGNGDSGLAVAGEESAPSDRADFLSSVAANGGSVADWVGAFASAVASMNGTADTLSRSLGAVSIIGPIVSVVALSSRCADIMIKTKLNEEELGDVYQRLRFLGESLFREAMPMLETCVDEEAVVVGLFDAFAALATVSARVERHILNKKHLRMLHANEAAELKMIVAEIEEKLRNLGMLRGMLRVALTNPPPPEPHSPVIVEEYAPTWIVPDKPNHFCQSALREWDRLRAALLSGGSSESLCRVAKVAIQGGPGVGKSVTSKFVANYFAYDHPGEFPGGVYFFTLGLDATPSSVCSSLENACERSGGVAEAEEIRRSGDADVAISIATEWFAGQKILVVLDGGWIRMLDAEDDQLHSVRRQWAESFADIPSGLGSAFLCTTRFDELAEFASVTLRLGHFDLSNESEMHAAVQMFNAYCGIDESHSLYSVTKRDVVLKFTGGLPIAIANCGAYMRRRRWDCEGMAESIFDFESAGTGGSLSAFMNLGLMDLDTNRERSVGVLGAENCDRLRSKFGHIQPFTVLFASLCVVQKTCPLHILGFMWDEPVNLVKAVLRLFQSYELVSLEPCEWVTNVVDAKMLAMHDLHYKHAKLLAQSLESRGMVFKGVEVSLASFHKALVSGVCRGILGEPLSPQSEWSRLLPSEALGVTSVDWYLLEHLIRHMELAIVHAEVDDMMYSCLDTARALFAESRGNIETLERAYRIECRDLEGQYRELARLGRLTSKDIATISFLGLNVYN